MAYRAKNRIDAGKDSKGQAVVVRPDEEVTAKGIGGNDELKRLMEKGAVEEVHANYFKGRSGSDSGNSGGGSEGSGAGSGGEG